MVMSKRTIMGRTIIIKMMMMWRMITGNSFDQTQRGRRDSKGESSILSEAQEGALYPDMLPH